MKNLKSKFNYISMCHTMSYERNFFFIKLIDKSSFYQGLYKITDAYKEAKFVYLDLIEISVVDNISVFKIMKFGKYRYSMIDRKKGNYVAKSKIHVKEIKIKLFICKRDYNNKINKIIKIFDKGHKVKVSFNFRGREFYKKDMIRALIKDLTDELSEYAIIENKPRVNDRQMYIFFRSRKIRYEY